MPASARPLSVATTDRPPRWARTLVATFSVVFLFCVVGGVELWPFSGMRLFSSPRTAIHRDFRVVSEMADGTRAAYPIDVLPRSERSLRWMLEHYRSLPDRQQAAACDRWLQGAKTRQPDVVALSLERATDRAQFRGPDVEVKVDYLGRCE